jgi:hypothetical protein
MLCCAGCFERVLHGILSGKLASAPDGNGLDEQTNAALDAVAAWRKRQPRPAPVALAFFNPPR